MCSAHQVERVRESRSAHWWSLADKHHHNYSTERPIVSPVTGGTIQTLENGRGFLSQAGKITPIHIQYRGPKGRQLDFVEREWPYVCDA